MTLKGCPSQACAACKYQRRKCTPECLLAPYFPADKPHMFRNVHRLFGVSNIIKILKSLDPSQQPEAMTSIIYQAKMRDMFPVHGCCQVIHLCVTQIRQLKEELDAVYAQIEICRQHFHQVSSGPDSIPSQLELGMEASVGLETEQFQALTYSSGGSCNIYDGYSSNNSASCIDGKNIGSIYMNENQYGCDNISSSCSVVPNQLMDSSQTPTTTLAIQQDFVSDFDELQPFFDTFDEDRQSFVESKELCESSSVSSVKDTMHSMEHVSNKELKTAAACFTLTSVN